MITKWGVKNFKSILDADLELAPLTIFTGVNSSGKSSFLQSIAMLAQSARRDDAGVITLNGDFLPDLGSFDQVYHKNSDESKRILTDKIGINCTFKLNENEDVNLKLELSKYGEKKLFVHKLSLESKKKEEDKDTAILNYSYNGEISIDEINLNYEQLQKVKSNINCEMIEWSALRSIFNRYSFLPDSLCFSDLLEEIFSAPDFEVEYFIKQLSDFPTKELTNEEAREYADKRFTDWDKRLVNELLSLCTRESYEDNTAPLNYIVPDFEELFNIFYEDDGWDSYFEIELADWYQVLSKQDKKKQESIKDKLLMNSFKDDFREAIERYKDNFNLELPKRLKNARDFLYNYFKFKIKYLAPLRVYPKDGLTDEGEPIKLENEDINTFRRRKDEYHQKMMNIGVGVNGENTMPLIRHLYDIGYDIENYFSPKYFEDTDYKPLKKKNIYEGLIEWLKYFDLADNFKKGELDNGLPTIDLVIKELKLALTQLGTGVSQILPVIVQCLITPVGSTLIIQEPEQNLHPKWQSLLADLFFGMSVHGRRCIIETHSEYIIKKLRYRIVADKDEKINKEIKIYFTTINENGESEFEEIEINEYGVITNWPEDFFDEGSKWAVDINKAATDKWERNK